MDHQTDNRTDHAINDKYRVMTSALEKKILKISKSNEKIAAR